MEKIYKYRLDFESNELILPANSKILSVEEQMGDIVLYALVNTDVKETEKRKVIIKPTYSLEMIDKTIYKINSGDNLK